MSKSTVIDLQKSIHALSTHFASGDSTESPLIVALKYWESEPEGSKRWAVALCLYEATMADGQSRQASANDAPGISTEIALRQAFMDLRVKTGAMTKPLKALREAAIRVSEAFAATTHRSLRPEVARLSELTTQFAQDATEQLLAIDGVAATLGRSPYVTVKKNEGLRRLMDDSLVRLRAAAFSPAEISGLLIDDGSPNGRVNRYRARLKRLTSPAASGSN